MRASDPPPPCTHRRHAAILHPPEACRLSSPQFNGLLSFFIYMRRFTDYRRPSFKMGVVYEPTLYYISTCFCLSIGARIPRALLLSELVKFRLDYFFYWVLILVFPFVFYNFKVMEMMNFSPDDSTLKLLSALCFLP